MFFTHFFAAAHGLGAADALAHAGHVRMSAYFHQLGGGADEDWLLLPEELSKGAWKKFVKNITVMRVSYVE